MSNPETYTVGWICAILTEYVAAQELLDEEHDPPISLQPNDSNHYTLGRIGGHNVVIAVLPDGEYGTDSAASVATSMLRTFPNTRIGLFVGIGGGAPSEKHDIRLGDIVVSAPRDGESGVFQYDFGKTIQDQVFQNTRSLDQPPRTLRTALVGIQARYQRRGHQLEQTIETILKRNPRLEDKYQRPPPDTDRLFKTDFVHDERGCKEFCAVNETHLIPRRERTKHEDNPAIHYGLIASANQLMKDAVMRDKLAAEKDVLCFEMEAAGLMNHFPCLIIRGICDYADSHKNKEWQGFSAMVAAAFAKDLLLQIPPSNLEAERRIGDILSGLPDIAKAHQRIAVEHCGIAKEQLKVQKDIAREKLSEEERNCHQLFRLTSSSKDSTYEWYKERIEERVENTCMWFLNHESFQNWLEQESGPLLVTADPGCGKSVLAKYLIDHVLPRSATICYFFFKDQDQNTLRQALCALLHQIFSQKPSLIEHAMSEFRKNGQGLTNSTASLWKILRNAAQDPSAGPTIIVFDALDECAESELEVLVQNIQRQFPSEQSGCGALKYLLTCRPYDQIVSKFRNLLDTFPDIRIPGEEESETITQEVNYVITRRVNRLAMKKRLSTEIKDHLEKRLRKTTHRTYLWVYLVFDYLEKQDFKRTPKGVESAIEILPRSINEAYDRILSKSKEGPMVRKVLSIILAASRPLTLSEMNVAVNVDFKLNSINDLDLEDDGDFRTRLRTWCGLFISIYQGSIYFIHQTAREFLLTDLPSPVVVPSGLYWHHSITIQEAHAVLSNLCILYLDHLNNSDLFSRSWPYDSGLPLWRYAAQTWGDHLREAHITDGDAIIPFVLGICDPASKICLQWLSVYCDNVYKRELRNMTSLMITSYFGHYVIVKVLLEKGAEVNAKDGRLRRTALSFAAANGHNSIVNLLLDKGANINAEEGRYHQTALSFAAQHRHDSVVKLLLDKGAKVDSSGYSQTPLLLAAKNGYGSIVKLLLDKGAEVNTEEGRYYRTALLLAAENGHNSVVKLLLDKGAKVDRTSYGQTPLLWAAKNGHESVVKLLLQKGADIEFEDIANRTPLSYAVGNGRKSVVKLLLQKGANIDAEDFVYRTPLSYAAENGRESIVKLLLQKGANIDVKDILFRTPLSYAAEKDHKAIIKLLLDEGADIEVNYSVNSRTPI